MKSRSVWFSGAIAGATLMAGVWRVYSRRTQQRVPSHEELDDADVVRAFARIATIPQMRLLRWYVARRATRMERQGQAVDLGCGPGHLAIKLAALAPELRVTGVDLSGEMLVEAEASARSSGVRDQVSFRKSDVQEIPFADDSLDLVVSTLSLHHWHDPVRVLDDVARVLRPGGSFIVFDLRRDLIAPIYMLLWFVTRFVVPPALRRVNEPLGSRDAAFTVAEAAELADQSKLTGWRIGRGPFWLTIEGKTVGP